MKKNRLIITILLFLTFISIITIYLYHSGIIFAKIDKTNNIETKYTLPVKYLVVDKEKTTDKVTIDEINDKKMDAILFSQVSFVPLYNKGDYYYAKLDNANSLLTDNTIEYIVANNNSYGEVITAAEYNSENKMFKIPKEYVEKRKNMSAPIQIELLSRATEKELENIKVKVKYNNTVKNINFNGNEITIDFSIYSYGKGKNLKKSDFDVVINKTYHISTDSINYDNYSGVLSLPISPVLAESISLKIKPKAIIKNGIFNVLKVKNISAVSFSKMRTYHKLKSAPVGIKKGDSYTVNMHVNYITDTNYNALSEDKKQVYKSSYKYLYGLSKCNWSEKKDVCNWAGPYNRGVEDSVHPFLLTLRDLKKTNDKGEITHHINFEGKTYAVLFCDHVGTAADGDGELDIVIKVLEYDATNKYMVLGFNTIKSIGTQNGYGVYKFKWDNPEDGQIKVRKQFKNGEPSSKAGYRFQLYETKNGCDNKVDDDRIGHEDTNSNGVATFEDLDFGTYYIREKVNKDGIPTQGDDNFVPVKNCVSVTVDETGEKTENTYIASKEFDNRHRKYCTGVYKADGDGDGYVDGITFHLNGASPTTTSGGTATWTHLPFGSYFIVESSPDGTTGLLNGTTGYKYWNNYSGASAPLTEMTYNSDDNTYSCPISYNVTATDNKFYYCGIVKKVDAKDPSKVLAGAKFSSPGLTSYNSAGVANGATLADGLMYFFTGTSDAPISVAETEAPAGYAASASSVTVSPVAMPKDTNRSTSVNIAKCNAVATPVLAKDDKLLLNWYKTTENGTTTVNGAQFKVRINGGTNNGKYVNYDVVEEREDASGVKKACYRYSGITDGGSTFTTMNTATKPAGTETATMTNGEACITGLPALEEGTTYEVIETQPAQYHTYGVVGSKVIAPVTSYAAMTDENKFVNLPTGFEFTKNVSSVDGGDGTDVIVVNGERKTLTELTTEELKKLDFEIYVGDANGNPTGSPLSFVKVGEGTYEYNLNPTDRPIGEVTTRLNLNGNRKIRVDHLAWGVTYVIREVQSVTCSGSDTDCIGYYYPNYNEQGSTFTVTTCSNPNANSTSCPSRGYATQTLTNTPTEIKFTKKDYYHYEDQADIIDEDRESDEVDNSAEFENDKERSDFDRITFKMSEKSSGKKLTLKFVKNVGDCKTDSSYALYKYVPGDQSDTNGTELHTCGGHIKITNLCRGNSYVMEEISVPEDSVFVKEDTNSTPTTVEYRIPCSDGSYTAETVTKQINDKGTRVRFEKRDSKYNYLIPDETTTFQVYRCKKGEKCHPSDYALKDENGILKVDEEKIKKAGMELVEFSERAVITGDEEDPKDAAGLAGVEVYSAMSDSDVKAGKKYVTDLHPYRGILVLRYLQSNYNYVLLETVAPKNYLLPTGRNTETEFTVTNETVSVEETDVPNKPTSILIRKYSDTGELLPGAEFKIYMGNANNSTTCDANLSAMNQPKTEMKFKTIRDGVYEYRPELTDTIIKTCEDEANGKCSDIPGNESTDLTYSASIRNDGLNNKYEGTWADWSNTETSEGKTIEIQEGEALIQYLEYGHCYIIEEVKAPDGYSLPKKEEDRFSMLYIDYNDSYYYDTEKAHINSPTPFTFYKYDEFNKLLDGAEFKLQKLDDNKKYHDVTVTEEEKEDGSLYYRVDENSSNITMRTKEGKATVYFLSQGQYRVVETKAAPGKEINKNPNIATFFVDSNGNVYGNALIVNKEKTKKIETKPTASAELIVNIQTGQTVIRYGLIITMLIAAITGLMIYNRKRK